MVANVLEDLSLPSLVVFGLSNFFFPLFLPVRKKKTTASMHHRTLSDLVLRYVDEDNIPQKLICSICLMPAVFPLVHAAPCNNLFCAACIERVLVQEEEKSESESSSSACPICHAAINNKTSNLSGSDFIGKLLDDLKVYCPFEKHGCKWVGDRASVIQHVTKSCETVPCGNEGCTLIMYAEAVETHTCDFEPVSCPEEECNEKVPRRLLNAHLAAKCSARQDKLARCDALNPKAEDVLTILCGDKKFRVVRSLLLKEEDSLLALMFSEQARKLNRDEKGRVVLNVRGETFGHLLTYLLVGKLPPLDEVEMGFVNDAIEAFGLDETNVPYRPKKIDWKRRPASDQNTKE